MTSVHNQKDVRIFQKECISLVKAGYEVFLVAPGENGIADKVHIIGFGENETKRWKRVLFSPRKVYRLAKKVDADIYHFHDPELLPYGFLLKKRGKKVIFDSHENLFLQMEEKSYIPIIFRKLFGKLFSGFLKIICRSFDAIISVDPQICDKYNKINSNTVLVSNFPIIEDEICNTKAPDNRIAFAGGVDQQWNHIAIIKALEKTDEKINYTICGRVDNNYLEMMKNLPGWNQVDYLGVLPHKQVLHILNTSRIGVALCNYSNNTNQKLGTLGNTKLFEIMMTGIPVICTKFVLWEKIIREYECGICIDDPQDSVQIAAAINYILDNPQTARHMGKQGRTAVRDKFNWKIEEKKLLDLYYRLT